MDKVVHFEVPADNLERVQKFYKECFGWKITDVSAPGMEYFMIHTVETDDKGMPMHPGAINGGFMKRTDEKGPIIVVNVDSIDKSLDLVKKAGGIVLSEKVKVGDMGLYARFRDPEGNVMAVWEDLKKSF
ncbi:VOC family protein [Candidatus Woesearchaeota archaeon]|nr:VOC family protein [Candidatus Woesearchaeota archaeon]